MAFVRALRPVKSLLIGIGRTLRPEGTAPRARRRPDVTVISPGGVATTSLIKHLQRFASVNSPHDLDGLKHLPRVPRPDQGFPKVLYVFGDLEEIHASLARRGMVGRQGAKLGCSLCSITFGKLQKTLFLRAVAKQIATFQAAQDERLMILRYEEIWDRAGEIAAFCGIEDERFVRQFPRKRPRTSR